MSSRTTTYISYGPRASSSSVSSRGSTGYSSYRVPVSDSSNRYGSTNDRVYSVTRNGVQVTNHNQRRSDPAEPRSSDSSGYYGGSSYRR
ncbi:hypothetical protein V491_06260 [Pseudogymnoascus sp. VKM F-3775]|nr:hypothetical protein V491_06260 [Pseudogymnoascus sp. VKM F-3775]